MENEQSSTAFKWVERYARAFDSIRVHGDRKQFLGDLVEAVIQISGASRAYAILMDGTQVDTQVGQSASGDAIEIDEELKKRAARSALAAVSSASNSDGHQSTAPHIEQTDNGACLPFRLSGQVSGSVLMDGLDPNGDQIRNLGLSATLVHAATGSRRSAEDRKEALERAERAEKRAHETERSVASGGVGAVAFLKKVTDLERDAIELALRTTSWNKEEAARRLGISRASIYMKVKKFGLQKPID